MPKEKRSALAVIQATGGSCILQKWQLPCTQKWEKRRRGPCRWDLRSLSFAWIGNIAAADLPSRSSPGLKNQKGLSKGDGRAPEGLCCGGVVWFPFITSLKTHLKGEKSGGWKAGAVPRGLTVGNFKYIQLLPLLQVEGGFLGREGAQFPSLQLTDGGPGQAGSNQPWNRNQHRVVVLTLSELHVLEPCKQGSKLHLEEGCCGLPWQSTGIEKHLKKETGST